MSNNAGNYVEAYLAERKGQPADIDRFVEQSSGLDAEGILAAISDPRVGSQAIELMADLMHPTNSMYYDAIYGAFHGQKNIRGWLVPTMAEIDFIEFVPQSEGAMFDDGQGGTSIDEWQMVANMDGQKLPLSKGVSVRRYRDGWITWNADVYDTGPFRQPPEPGEDPAIPDWPRTPWTTNSASNHHQLPAHRDSNPSDIAALLHPDATYEDPMLGPLSGGPAIAEAIIHVGSKMGNTRFDPIGPRLFNGDASVEEWLQVAVQRSGAAVPVARGTTVRRYTDGLISSTNEYFDTAPFADAHVQEAAHAAGSTLSEDDINRFKAPA